MDPTIIDAPIVFTSILQLQVVKLLIAVDQDRFLQLDHKFMSTMSSLLSGTVVCCTLLTFYLTNGTLCDKFNLILFLNKHDADIVVENVIFTKTNIRQIFGICIVTTEVFRRSYKNWNKIKNYSKKAISLVMLTKCSSHNTITPLNSVSI